MVHFLVVKSVLLLPQTHNFHIKHFFACCLLETDYGKFDQYCHSDSLHFQYLHQIHQNRLQFHAQKSLTDMRKDKNVLEPCEGPNKREQSNGERTK